MKKIMILMALIVSMTTAVFADSYVAFTSKEGLEVYCNSDFIDFDWVKEGFEEGISDFTNQQKKKATFIVVVDDEVNAIYYILLYAYDSKTFGSIVFDGDFNCIKKCNIYPDTEVDPVLICSSIISEEVSHILNIDKKEVVFAVAEE